VISPDNRSRIEINERVHAELQRGGLVSNEEHRIRTLVPRQDLTGADRTWAERYEVGDVLRYSRASKETGIGKGAYAQVKSIDAPKNWLTVELQDATQRTYDPRRQQGVSVFREEMRSFSVGDRIQFTAPANDLRVANRELGTIKSIDEDGRLCLRMDGGRTLELDPPKHPHLGHGENSSRRRLAFIRQRDLGLSAGKSLSEAAIPEPAEAQIDEGTCPGRHSGRRVQTPCLDRIDEIRGDAPRAFLI